MDKFLNCIKSVILRFGVEACVTRRLWRKFGRLSIVQDLSGDCSTALMYVHYQVARRIIHLGFLQ